MKKLLGNTGKSLALRRFMKSYLALLIGFLVICIAASFGSEYFLTTTNLMNVLRQIASTLCCAMASMMIMITGGIDQSVASILSLSGVLIAGMVTWSGWPTWAAILFAMAAAVVAGLANGLLAAHTKMPPFIITYAIGSICKGITFIYSNAENIRITNEDFVWMGVGMVGIVPVPVIIAAIIIVICWFILNKTKLGRNMYAIGGNPQAAQYAGINVVMVTLFVYIFSGLMSGLAGIMTAARNYSGMPKAGTSGSDITMDAIAAVTLGGVSMGGGKGGVFGAVLGTFIIGVLGNALNLAGINSYYQYIVKGVVLLIAVYFDYRKKK